MSDWPFLLDFARARRGEPMALASLVAREGSSYRLPGARMLVAQDGSHVGTLSGGCLEEGIAQVARQVIATGQPEFLDIDTRRHFGCPGKLRILVERLTPDADPLVERIAREISRRRPFQLITDPSGTRLGSANPAAWLIETVGLQPRLVLIGSSSDGDPLLKFAAALGWQLHRVVRNEPHAPVAGEAITTCPADALGAAFVPDSATAMLVMTHHLASDLHYLKNLLPLPYRYIGLLGSRRRRETILAEIGACGLLQDPAVADRLYAPVGLDLGGNHPATIALAVVAEIQAVFAETSAGSLRDRLGSIHLPTQ